MQFKTLRGSIILCMLLIKVKTIKTLYILDNTPYQNTLGQSYFTSLLQIL